MTEPERRRRRPVVSCSVCKRRKIRCNRETPCSNCVRSRNETCIYENQTSQPSRPRLGDGSTAEIGLAQGSPHASASIGKASSINRMLIVPSHPSNSLLTPSTTASTFSSQPSTPEYESMKNRIKELEALLSKATQRSIQSPPPTSNSNIKTTTSRIAGTFSVENRLSGQAEAIPRSVMHKNRLFGQSHWINGLTMFLEILEIIEPLIRDETSKAYSGIQKCKALAYIIKSRRAPPWPSLPRVDLPPKGVADELVDCYLRTFETLYRILHIPTFKRDYEALWMSDVERNAAFLIQVKLVLAIGATTYDEQFSLRTSAIQWIYEAQIWLSVPESKSRLNIISLQISLLLLLARETASVSGDMTWISAGALLRSAVYMGLHRDPALLPKMTTFAAEMRRRLWNTILEITLQSSMTLGGAPFISLEDFNAEPPGNFDDEQLVAEDPVPKPESDFTQMSIAIALRKIFPLRLAITKFLNDLDSQGSYEETLRLDTELRVSCKILRHTLQGFNSKNTKPSPSRFEMRAVDFIMNRYLSSLHIPFFGSSLHEPTYAFSRKVLLETSLKIWCAAYPSSSIMTAQSHSAIDSSARNDFARLTACGSGFFRTVALQASVLIAAELGTQLQEEESIGPMPFRPDLFSVLDDAKTWGLLCIKAGETNMKGYLLTCLIAAQVEGLKCGLGKDELPRFLVKAAEDAEDTCLPILEKAAQAQAGETIDQLDLMPLNMAPELVENWEFTMTDSLFNMGNIEQMDWGFNGGTAQESSLW